MQLSDDESLPGLSDLEQDEALFDVEACQSPALQALGEAQEIISCLMRISMALRNPARNDQVRYAATTSQVAQSYWAADTAHVRDKFPKLADTLAERLGMSISLHRQYLKYREEHNDKMVQGIDDQHPYDETMQSTVGTTPYQPMLHGVSTESGIRDDKPRTMFEALC
jgi:hypothetical protein